MKKTYLTLLILFYGLSSWAQNTFPGNGNVGIGTASPNGTLEVNGTIVAAGNTSNLDVHIPNRSLGFLENTGQVLVGWNRSAAGGETDFISNQGAGGAGGFAFYDHNNSGLETQLMWIRGDGNVSIGTPDPHGYKFAVNGNIRAKEIKVEAGPWPDYVFDKAYRLMPLTELQSYLDSNHHLPGMPSARQVAQKGVKLGEMNRALTQKVEEMSLYLIEKDKELRAQQLRIQKLEALVGKLVKNVE